MMYRKSNARLATTAIAAVLAFTSTPLIAQDATSTAEPVAEASPEPVVADPLAPTATETVATATAAKPASETAPAAAKAPTRTKASTVPARRTAAASPAPRQAAATTSAPAEPAPPIAPAAETLATEPPVEAIAPPVAAPPVESAPTVQALDMDDALPIGAGALGLLALAGAGMALRRRKHRQDEVYVEDRWVADEDQAAAPVVEPEPGFVHAAIPAATIARRPKHDPVIAGAPVTALPPGFDTSRFGRHVQAAYRGPTPDNPSLSMKYRLRRASALDQRERLESQKRAEAPAARPAAATAGFMLRKDEPQPALRPAYSR